MINPIHSQQLALIGERGCGKTSFILDLVEAFQKSGVAMAGIVSIGIFEQGEKVAIEVVDLMSGESRLLARIQKEVETDLRFGDWSFFPETFEWANQQLGSISQTDLLILDEIGPLELDQGSGFQDGLSLFEKGNFHLGILTARPKCVVALQNRLTNLKLFLMTSWDKNELFNYILSFGDRIKWHLNDDRI
jgi:nucleoside-triphosphatase THEP1